MDATGGTFSGICEVVQIASATALGLFAGAMLTEGCVLVPYWRSLRPQEFLTWYGAHGHRLQGFFGPLTIAAAVLAMTAAAFSATDGHAGRWLALLAAAVTLVVVSMFFVYFKKANESFATASVGAEQVAAELSRWSKWHWWRTALSFVALAAALLVLRN